MKWTTTQLITIGALAALRLFFSLPGILIASVTGVYFLKNISDFIVIPIMYVLVALIIKKPGSLTLWTFILGIFSLLLPFMGPPGFFPKIIVLVAFGILGDITYLIFRRWKRLSAIMIGMVELGPGIAVEFLMWTILGVPGLAKAAEAFFSPLYVVAGSGIGAALGYVGWLIYRRIENTAVVKRIQA